MYSRTSSEIAVACLIGANFLSNLVEATIDPQKSKWQSVFNGLELCFNVVFTLELTLNMYAHWCYAFWSSGWNVFDFVVVLIGLLTTFQVPMPGPMKLLRMMRAFRVFRLFKRVKSLKRIMDSLGKAIPGVINAFIIQLLVISIYSILAVEFWSLYGRGGSVANELGEHFSTDTVRNMAFGEELFGNFPKALFTMFQVLTGDSWAEGVVRPLLHGEEVLVSIGVAIFFVTFILLNSVILINVVVAVLLEKMVEQEEPTPAMPVPQPEITKERDDLPLRVPVVGIKATDKEATNSVSNLRRMSTISSLCSDSSDFTNSPPVHHSSTGGSRTSRQSSSKASSAGSRVCLRNDLKACRSEVDGLKDHLKCLMEVFQFHLNSRAPSKEDILLNSYPNCVPHRTDEADSSSVSDDDSRSYAAFGEANWEV